MANGNKVEEKVNNKENELDHRLIREAATQKVTCTVCCQSWSWDGYGYGYGYGYEEGEGGVVVTNNLAQLYSTNGTVRHLELGWDVGKCPGVQVYEWRMWPACWDTQIRLLERGLELKSPDVPARGCFVGSRGNWHYLFHDRQDVRRITSEREKEERPSMSISNFTRIG